MMDRELDLDAIENTTPVRMQAMIDAMAVRTTYFDDYFIDATGTGVRQAVILASGLDSRAYRLPWPDGTVVVYEIDQPQVVDLKTTMLAGIGAEPTTRRTVAIDLRRTGRPH